MDILDQYSLYLYRINRIFALKKYTKEQKSASIHLDMRGNFLLFLSIFCLLISLTSWSSHSIFNISVYGNFLLFMIVFCLFIVWELKTNHPIINLHLFKNLSSFILANRLSEFDISFRISNYFKSNW